MEKTTEKSPESGPDKQAVTVMVHGTFSGAPDDAGERWWQSGSPVASRIGKLLPASTRVASGDEVFHWSGENSERARSKAATKLLRHLHMLEERGHDYHLVGHSHGGSVIWNALQFSVLTKRPLKRLGSWTTIGTPFMQHRSQGVLNPNYILGLILGLVLFPAWAAPKQLVKTLFNIAVDNHSAVILQPDEAIGYETLIRAPVLVLIESFGIPVNRQIDGIHVGSFDPGGDQSLARYFFATPEGLFILLIMIGMSYLFIHCAVLCISPAIESLRFRLERRLHRRAFEVYGSKWLGIWSPDDEAINGLRATLDMSVSFVSKMVPREIVYVSDIFALVSRPYYWLFAPIYNRFVHPAVDGKVRNLVVRAAQGNDRPIATLTDVTACPVANTECAPPLPALMNLKLLSFANRHAHELVPKLRGLIAQNSLTSGLEAFGSHLSGKELVHTAYFEQDEILKLIASNVQWESASGEPVNKLPPMPTWLRKWFIAFKQGTAEENRTSETSQLSPLGKDQHQSNPTQRKAG